MGQAEGGPHPPVPIPRSSEAAPQQGQSLAHPEGNQVTSVSTLQSQGDVRQKMKESLCSSGESCGATSWLPQQQREKGAGPKDVEHPHRSVQGVGDVKAGEIG